MQENSVEERRQFLTKAASLLGITICSSSLASLLTSCEKDESKLIATHGTFTIDLSSETGLANIGDGVKKSVGTFNSSKPVIIVRSSANAFAVFSSTCNHAGCEVSAPKSAGAAIVCDPNDNKCGHNAEFSSSTGLQIVGASGGAPTGGLTVISSTYDSASNKLTLSF